MRLIRTAVTSLATILTITVIHGCANPEPPESVQDRSEAIALTPAATPISERRMPTFSKTTTKGDSLSSASLAGKVILVNFWATWCGPCVEETPELVALRNEWAGQNFEILGISMDEEGVSVIDEFADRFNISYPLINDISELGEEFGGVYALPTTYVVDHEGNIVHRFIGVFPVSEMKEELAELIAISEK